MPRLVGAMICLLLGTSAGPALAQVSTASADLCPRQDRPLVLQHWRSELPPVGLGEVAAAQSVTLDIPASCPGSQIQLTIEWDNPADDLDLDLLDPNGYLAARADRLNPMEGEAAEQLAVNIKQAGTYQVAVRNYAAQPTAYRGRAVWVCQRPQGCAGDGSSPKLDRAPAVPELPTLREGQLLTLHRP